MDYKNKIIEELEIIRKSEIINKNIFKARAYGKVITQLKSFNDKITSFDDVKQIEGIGKSIEDKIKEIITTGVSSKAEAIKENSEINISNELLKIYGVGSTKASQLVKKYSIRSIEQLRELIQKDPNTKILNDKQKVGLKYLEEIEERIPRNEMVKHEKYIFDIIKNTTPLFLGNIVGSYRRGLANSGDIDILITYKDISAKKALEEYNKLIDKLIENGYITDILAKGSKKCMGVCRLLSSGKDFKHRRIDLLLTTPTEYPYALLYFTGSDKFNIEFRKLTLEAGYSLNEHGLKIVKDGLTIPKNIETEQDIFDFFKIKYLNPNERSEFKIIVL